MKLIKANGYLVCRSCSLKTLFLDEPALNAYGVETDVRERDFIADTPKDMITHLKQHFKNNKSLAKINIKKLKQEYNNLNKPIN